MGLLQTLQLAKSPGGGEASSSHFYIKKLLVGGKYRVILRRNMTYRPSSKMADYILDDILSGIA